MSCNPSVLLSGNVRVEQYVQTYILLAMVGNIYFSQAHSLLTTPVSVSEDVCLLIMYLLSH